MLIGGAVADARLNEVSWALFGLLYLWQFPHAIAIAWIYQHQYAQAGLQVASVQDPSGRLSGRLAMLGGTVVVPVSLLPVWLGDGLSVVWRGGTCLWVGVSLANDSFLANPAVIFTHGMSCGPRSPICRWCSSPCCAACTPPRNAGFIPHLRQLCPLCTPALPRPGGRNAGFYPHSDVTVAPGTTTAGRHAR